VCVIDFNDHWQLWLSVLFWCSYCCLSLYCYPGLGLSPCIFCVNSSCKCKGLCLVHALGAYLWVAWRATCEWLLFYTASRCGSVCLSRLQPRVEIVSLVWNRFKSLNLYSVYSVYSIYSIYNLPAVPRTTGFLVFIFVTSHAYSRFGPRHRMHWPITSVS